MGITQMRKLFQQKVGIKIVVRKRDHSFFKKLSRNFCPNISSSALCISTYSQFLTTTFPPVAFHTLKSMVQKTFVVYISSFPSVHGVFPPFHRLCYFYIFCTLSKKVEFFSHLLQLKPTQSQQSMHFPLIFSPFFPNPVIHCLLLLLLLIKIIIHFQIYPCSFP